MTTTALITGATSGIGRAAADKLAKSGVHVMVVGRNVERGERTIAEIRAAGGKADFISSDLRDAASARAVAKKALELGNGHVDVLINNAGVFPFGPTPQMSEEAFDDVYALNVKAPYFLVAELAPFMAQRGKGAIVNVSTMVAAYGAASMAAEPPYGFRGPRYERRERDRVPFVGRGPPRPPAHVFLALRARAGCGCRSGMTARRRPPGARSSLKFCKNKRALFLPYLSGPSIPSGAVWS